MLSKNNINEDDDKVFVFCLESDDESTTTLEYLKKLEKMFDFKQWKIIGDYFETYVSQIMDRLDNISSIEEMLKFIDKYNLNKSKFSFDCCLSSMIENEKYEEFKFLFRNRKGFETEIDWGLFMT